MGYAFLYGVFGSLIGSSLGGALYGAWLKPLAGSPEGIVASRNFWLLFVLLDVFAVVGLFFYNRAFAHDTPEANAKARMIMIGLYASSSSSASSSSGWLSSAGRRSRTRRSSRPSS